MFSKPVVFEKKLQLTRNRCASDVCDVFIHHPKNVMMSPGPPFSHLKIY